MGNERGFRARALTLPGSGKPELVRSRPASTRRRSAGVRHSGESRGVALLARQHVFGRKREMAPGRGRIDCRRIRFASGGLPLTKAQSTRRKH